MRFFQHFLSQKGSRQLWCKLLMLLSTQSHYQICQTLVFLCNTSLCGLVHAAPSSATTSPVLFKPEDISTSVTALLIFLCSQLFQSQADTATNYCQSFLSFPFSAKQGYIATGKYSTSIWRLTSCHKGNNCGHKAAPKVPVQQSVLISNAFKHMFTCRLIIIFLRLSRAVLFCLWFMDP